MKKRKNKMPPDGQSKLARFVLARLPEDFVVTAFDLAGLNVCDSFLDYQPTPENVVRAVRRACRRTTIQEYCDPIELLIEAGICDPDFNAVA